MAVLAEVETTPIGFASKSAKRYQEKVKREEEELAELEKQAAGQTEDKSEEEEQKEPVQEEPASEEEKTFKKRYGDLRRHHNEKIGELESKIKELESKSNNVKVAYPANDETLEQWKKKYPDVAAIVETVAQQIADERMETTGSALEELRKGQAEMEKEKHLGTIRKAHTDFDKLKESNDFHDWMDEQPKWAQEAIYENTSDPKSAIRVIDLYKSDKGLTKEAKKSKEKDAAKDVAGSSRTSPADNDEGKKWRESDVSKMSVKEWEDREDEIMKAMRDGNFIYDISGSAR